MNKYFLFLALIVLSSTGALAQKFGYIDSDSIRERYPEAKQAERLIKTIVEDWKCELNTMQRQIDDLRSDIQTNGAMMTESERSGKEKELQALISQKELYAKSKFEPNGEYDTIVKQVLKPIEEKIKVDHE